MSIEQTTVCLAPHNNRDEHAAEAGFLCVPAYLRLEQQIAELPALTTWLHANLASGGSGQSGDGSKRTKGEPPIPIRDAVHDHVQLIEAVLREWCAEVAEKRQLHGPRTPNVRDTATYLLAHLPWCAQQNWIGDLAGEIAEHTRAAHMLAPSKPARHPLGIGCPKNDCAGELTRDDGASYIECRDCGTLISESEYPWFTRCQAEQIRDASGWVTPEKAAAEHGLNPKTVRSWAKRGVIAVACAVLPGERDDRWRVHPDEVAARTQRQEAS